MKMQKIKTVQILSDGSTNFSYKIFYHNEKNYIFFDKDYIKLDLNLKNLIKIKKKNNAKKLNDFKEKYII